MENLDYNKDFELITQYIDGELSQSQMLEVDKMMQNSPELQAEFDKQLEISKSIDDDDETFVPPPSVKDNVFLALGIPLAASAPTLTKLLTESAANWVSIAAAVVASVATLTMYSSLNSDSDANSKVTNNIPIVKSYEVAANNNIIVIDEAISEDAEIMANNSAEILDAELDNNANSNAVSNSRISQSSANSNSNIVSNASDDIVSDVGNSESLASNLSDDDLNNTNDADNQNINSNISDNLGRNSNNVAPWDADFAYQNTEFNGFARGMMLTENNNFKVNRSYTRDYLTVIRTKASTNSNNNGQLDVSFLTNYFTTDLRGMFSAGMSYYGTNYGADLRNPFFLGGGVEYTPTFTKIFANSYFDTFVNGQIFLGQSPSYKMEAGLTTTLGGLTRFPIVFGYSQTIVRDYQFIGQQSQGGIFIGTEITF
jgi:hypothetical protein